VYSPQALTLSSPSAGGQSSTARLSLRLPSFALGGSALLFGYKLSTITEPAAVAQSQAAEVAPTPPANPYAVPSQTTGRLPKSIVLYQYEVCPFCCKVKAFLDYHKLPYRVVEVNPLTKAELKWSEYKKVPVVLLDDKEQVNDSSAIISRLDAEIKTVRDEEKARERKSGRLFANRRSSVDAPYVKDEEEERWRRWVDERFVRVITVNIYRTARESWQTFDYITDHGNFTWFQREAARIAGSTMMWSLSSRLKKKYEIEGDVREALFACADDWVAAIGNRKFLGGDAPNLADLAVFGVIRSIVGTDTFMDLQHKTTISPWYERMMTAVGESSVVRD
jgi:microsomal prostaglandin-E synthase 2